MISYKKLIEHKTPTVYEILSREVVTAFDMMMILMLNYHCISINREIKCISLQLLIASPDCLLYAKKMYYIK